MFIHPIWTWLWNISSFFLPLALILRTLYTVLLKKKKKPIELSTDKTYQEKLGFLALFRIEQGFPYQRKLKSTKGKQAETIGAYSGQAERRRRKQLGGPGASPDAKIFYQFADTKVQCVSTGNILLEFFSSPLYVREIFLGRWSCAEIFFLRICALQDIAFPNSPPPPLRKKELC